MRRVPANKLATMVATSTSLVANAGTAISGMSVDLTTVSAVLRTAGAAFRASVMALTPILLASHEAQADDETQQLQEVVVTSTLIYDYVNLDQTSPVLELNIGSETTGSDDGTSIDTYSATRSAVRCALMYSFAPLGGRWGNAPGWDTQIDNTKIGWGNFNPPGVNPYYPPEITTPSTSTSPPLSGFDRIDGYTHGGTSIIWVINNQMSATNSGDSLQAYLVNTIVHEWWHEWYGPDEAGATAAGNEAEEAYKAHGGNSQGACPTGT